MPTKDEAAHCFPPAPLTEAAASSAGGPMPITSQKNNALQPMANDLGFGGAQLAEQLRDETEEEKRRRLMGMSLRGGGPGLLSRANPALSPATLSMFGTMGGAYGR